MVDEEYPRFLLSGMVELLLWCPSGHYLFAM